jgi:glutathione synthase/RimK-type ligase-like ATP-grasp enzyme
MANSRNNGTVASKPGGGAEGASRHIVIFEKESDREWASTTGRSTSARDYVTQPNTYASRQSRIINLSGSYDYMELGYYCSLLAEARGQKAIPRIETILRLWRRNLYADDLPELNALLRRDLEKADRPPRAAFTLTVCFGETPDVRFRNFCRGVFDRFRAPILRVQIDLKERWQVRAIELGRTSDLSPAEFDFFLTTLERYTRANWKDPKVKTPPRYWLAILHNPEEPMPPSDAAALRKFVAVGTEMGLGVELIQKKDYLKIGEYDALFIRETTSLENHTYRFSQKAVNEGLVAIDDPTSILRCTNKVYLAELLKANGIPTPETYVLDRSNILDIENKLPYPIVLKVPDSAFSRGVFKVDSREELLTKARKLFERTAVILAQRYMYTPFDWRVGVLGNQPLFVSQYFMARSNWQIVSYDASGGFREGPYKTVAVADAPPEVVEAGVRAANLVGNGLYGVDIKQTPEGVFVIEINDNPSLERGVEDAVLKDDLYKTILREFVTRIENRTSGQSGPQTQVLAAAD